MTDQPKQADPEVQAEMHKAIEASIRRAVEAGQYMVVVYRIEENKIKLERTSVNFPVVDFVQLPVMLQRNLGEETATVEGTVVPEKMEEAQPEAPVINLFGDQPKPEEAKPEEAPQAPENES